MAVVEIPLTRDTSTFEQTVVLDGVEYVFDLKWNSRVSRWFVSIRDIDGATLIAGRKLCTDRPLLARETSEDLPPGDLWLINTTGSGIDPGLRDLGQDVRLIYVEAS